MAGLAEGLTKPNPRLSLTDDSVELYRGGVAIAHRPADASRRAVASSFGPPLLELADAPAWPSASEPGWVSGLPLAVGCPIHDEPLRWWSWAHPDAPARVRRNCACCGECSSGDADAVLKTKEMMSVLHAAARMKAEQLEGDRGEPHSVYVLEVLGDAAGYDVYVGMTSKSIAERVDEQRSGIRPAKVFGGGSAQVGPLRLDRPGGCQRGLPHLAGALHQPLIV